MSELLAQILSSTAAATPDKEAISYLGQARTYAELWREVEAVAQALLRAGVGRHQRVGVFLEKRLEVCSAIIGTTHAGAVFVPINPVLKPAQVAYIMRDCNLTLLITSPSRLAELRQELSGCPDLKQVVLVDETASSDKIGTVLVESWNQFLSHGARAQLAPHVVTDTEMAGILYTSGSTGNPKGVVVSHRNLVAGAKSVAQYLKYQPSDRIINIPPYSFDFGLNQLLSTLHAGATAILFNYLAPQELMRALVQNKVTGLSAVPTVFIQLVAHEWPKQVAEQLRYISTTGGRMPEATVKALRTALPKTDIYLMYGLTESFRSTYLPPSEVDRRPNSIGKAIPNAEVLVVRPDGSICDPEEPGELVHKGVLVSLGYWNDPARTAERFRPAPGVPKDAPNPEIAVWSGDTVKRDKDGFIYFVGRRDEMIKTSGYRVSPTEIEEVVFASGLVANAAAVGVEHSELGQSICVFVIPKTEGAAVDIGAVLAHCRRSLPAYMMPQRLIPRDRFPVNANGKTDRKKLAAELVQSTEPAADAGMPAPAAGGFAQRFLDEALQLVGVRKRSFRRVRDVFAWAFNDRAIDERDSFITLGGDSLTFVQASQAIEEFFGHLPAHWERMSIRELEGIRRSAATQSTVGVDLILRAAAILAVCATHSGLAALEGGTSLMFVLSGASFAKYNWSTRSAEVFQSVYQAIRKLAPPALLLLAVSSLATGQFPWGEFLFIQNWLQDHDTFWSLPTWFLQVLFQIFLLMALLSAIPGIGRLGRDRAFEFGLVFVAGALCLHSAISVFGDSKLLQYDYLTPFFLWQFAMGWLLFASDAWWRRVATLAVVFAGLGVLFLLRGENDDWTLRHNGAYWLAIGMALLLWAPPVKLPVALGVVISVIARATFIIYLFHLPIQYVLVKLGVESPAAIFPLALGGSVLVWVLIEATTKILSAGSRDEDSMEAEADRI